MIAIDTNILLRRILDDDKEQAAKAAKLFEGERQVLITDVVLAETVWTLAGKRYRVTKEKIYDAIVSLFEETNVLFENSEAVWSALNDFIAAKPAKTADGTKSADFADALIVNKAMSIAIAMQLRYEGTYTFDQAALLLDGTKAP